MIHINIVIMEVLRSHPSASTAHMTMHESSFTVKAATGEEYLMGGLVMYMCVSIIQRDPNVFDDTADEWIPERWLGKAANDIPASAWQPFERGPKNCVGFRLASLQT